ncbi:MAG: hypothetical protein MUO31_13545 [Thermodesulfovibrionales bacterium]|nr:hypothetical protein [Thermodesulfovibrionales bacterium]
MTDNELRGLILKKYYEKRREQNLHFKSSDFTPPIPDKDIIYISDQLAEHNLIHWNPIRTDSNGLIDGIGHISAFGVDVVENDGADAPIKITFDQSTHYSVHSSANVQIGDANVQGNSVNLNQIIEAINNSDASTKEKREVKSRLSAFLKHPLVVTLLGKLVPSIDKMIMP